MAASTQSLPPSAAFALDYLRRNGETSVSQLRDELPIANRTLAYGLSRLRDMGFVEKRDGDDDARRSYYRPTNL